MDVKVFFVGFFVEIMDVSSDSVLHFLKGVGLFEVSLTKLDFSRFFDGFNNLLDDDVSRYSFVRFCNLLFLFLTCLFRGFAFLKLFNLELFCFLLFILNLVI